MTDPIVEALDAYVPPFEPSTGDWEAIREAASRPAVLAPGGRSRSRRDRPNTRRWRPLSLAAAAVGALALASVAVAGGLGAFDGIGAAQHPQTSGDKIDSATAAVMQGKGCTGSAAEGAPPCQPLIAGLLLDTARRLGQLPSGQNVYAITTTQNHLCFVVGPPYPEWACDAPVSQSTPTTVFTYGADPTIPWTSFGITVDGVTAVSFQASSGEVTVPVKSNLWTYQWPAGDDEAPAPPVTATFADGTTVAVSN